MVIEELFRAAIAGICIRPADGDVLVNPEDAEPVGFVQLLWSTLDHVGLHGLTLNLEP